jgi:hypothetical protein
MTTRFKAFSITLLIMGLFGLFLWCCRHYPNVMEWVLVGISLLVGFGFIYMMVYEVISDGDSRHRTR